MPKKIPQAELILEIVSRFPGGASIEEILIGLTPQPPRRTLQYRLSSLVKKGLLAAEGVTKAKRYKLPIVEKREKYKHVIPLSTAAESIESEVSRPIQERLYVSYNRELLDQYIPNQSFYLKAEDRKKLFEIGKTDGDRPAGTYARQIYNRILIDLAWNSSRLEGNTYSLLETERLLELGVAAEGKDRRETQMILNHKAVIEFMVESAENIQIDKYTITNIHSLLAQELLPDASCGSLRTIPVGIGGSVYLPLALPQLISECFEQILHVAKNIKDPFEQSFFMMVHLPYLQPFEDVNKRVSRLSANIPLFRENLCPLSFVEVPEQTYINGLLGIYELNRIDLLREVFIWAYEQSCRRYSATRKTLGDPDPFRMRYRDLRRDVIVTVVRQLLNKESATRVIRSKAQESIPVDDQLKFIEVVETELISLHRGNIARYGLHPAEFDEWHKGWH